MTDLIAHYDERIAAKQAELDAFIPQAEGDIARREKQIAQAQQELQNVLQQYRNQSSRLQGAIDVLKEERATEQARVDAEAAAQLERERLEAEAAAQLERERLEAEAAAQESFATAPDRLAETPAPNGKKGN